MMTKKFVMGLVISKLLLAQVLTLGDLIDSALANNPEIRAAKAHYEATLNTVSNIRYLPDPWLELEFSKDMPMYSISQELPFPTKLGTRQGIARNETGQALNDYYNVVNRVIELAKGYYWKLYLNQIEQRLSAESKKTVERISIIAENHYRLGHVPQADVIHTRVSLLKLENRMRKLKNEQSIIISALNNLINHPPDKELLVSIDSSFVPLEIGIDSLYVIARTHSPVLKLYQLRMTEAQLNISMAKQEYLPDFMLKYGTAGMDLNKYKIIFSLTIPLWFWAKQKSMVAEMQSEARMAQAEYQGIENEIVQMLNTAKIMLENYEREIKLFEDSIIPALESALRSIMRAYEINKADINGVLDTYQMLIEEKIEYYRARVDYFMTLAEIERIVGYDLIDWRSK